MDCGGMATPSAPPPLFNSSSQGARGQERVGGGCVGQRAAERRGAVAVGRDVLEGERGWGASGCHKWLPAIEQAIGRQFLAGTIDWSAVVGGRLRFSGPTVTQRGPLRAQTRPWVCVARGAGCPKRQSVCANTYGARADTRHIFSPLAAPPPPPPATLSNPLRTYRPLRFGSLQRTHHRCYPDPPQKDQCGFFTHQSASSLLPTPL